MNYALEAEQDSMVEARDARPATRLKRSPSVDYMQENTGEDQVEERRSISVDRVEETPDVGI